MKQRLLGAALLAGLASPALAATYNTIAIDNSAGSVGSLSITQDDATGNNTNTVSGDGLPSGTRLPISGPWSAIAINQQNGGNTLEGSVKTAGSSTTAALTANYTGTTGSAGNVHALNIGGTTAPLDPTVTVNAKNNGATANTVTDTLDGASLTYNLGLLGTANAVTNMVSATGGVTLTEGGGAYGIAGGYGIQGDNNTITNIIGQTTPVGSFSHTLLVSGSNNLIANTVDSGGDKVVNQSLTATSSNNTVRTTVSGGGAQTANLTLTNTSYVDYGLTSAAGDSYADVSLTNMGGTNGSPAIVRVEQTASAPGASVTLSVNGGGNTLGQVSGIPGTYSASNAGVSVYQNSTGTPTNTSSGASVSVYQSTPGMPVTISATAATPGYTVSVRQ